MAKKKKLVTRQNKEFLNRKDLAIKAKIRAEISSEMRPIIDATNDGKLITQILLIEILKELKK